MPCVRACSRCSLHAGRLRLMRGLHQTLPPAVVALNAARQACGVQVSASPWSSDPASCHLRHHAAMLQMVRQGGNFTMIFRFIINPAEWVSALHGKLLCATGGWGLRARGTGRLGCVRVALVEDGCRRVVCKAPARAQLRCGAGSGPRRGAAQRSARARARAVRGHARAYAHPCWLHMPSTRCHRRPAGHAHDARGTGQGKQGPGAGGKVGVLCTARAWWTAVQLQLQGTLCLVQHGHARPRNGHCRLMSEGKVRPVVATVLPLEAIREAQVG